MKHTLYAVVKIEVISELPIEDLIDELGSESYYTIDGTDNIEVIETEWLDTSTQNPL